MKGLNFPKEVWLALICAAVVIVSLFCVTGYAGGYGKLVDGKVDVNYRASLFSDMLLDYKRDGGEWSFGYFVPLAVAGLFFCRRKELMKTPVQPALVSGAFLLLLGFLFYWAGYRGHQKYFGYASGQIVVLGAILWFLGWKWFGQVFWLWVLLGMMWPWRFLIERISAPLQLIMVKLTSGFMNLIGVDAVASGSALTTGSLDPITKLPISLDIHVECSGMRSLFALVMIGLVFAFLRVRDEWKRWVLMAFVPFVAVAGNFVRMLMLFFGSLLWGTKFAIGEGHHDISPFHIFSGLAVFVVALVLMSLLVSVLEGGWKKVFKKSKVVRREIVRENEG
ncbi:exosortase/archaeosortase family protein [Roseibacillus persicicus]|uniref:exosortase/archaeosortase family protein n=1 Tax=Roseibacillus persicicus TaxID=454148 RepID=UPI00280F48C9|nr:exosortase/archaeosortase family protein [Roseibacillus persicicus]MDQ8188866.1 exosortase/archaeosortase family protein [Roseibacillus persicicus]